MYCTCCGMKNPESETLCFLCNAPLEHRKDLSEQKIFVDLTLFPYKAVLKSLKEFNPIIQIILLPIISALYFVHKFFKTRFLTPILNSYVPKFEQINIQDPSHKINPKTLEPVLSYLRDQNFEHMIDLEDKSMVQSTVLSFFVNRSQKIFCSLHINKTTRRLQHTTFFVFSLDRAYYSIDNTYAIPIDYPEKINIYHFPELSVQQLHEAMIKLLTEQNVKPMLINLRSVLVNGCKLRKLSIEKGLSQGRLYQKGQGVMPCYHHPFQSAVKTCSICGSPICEACYMYFNQQYFCKNCGPKTVEHKSPLSQLQMSYSGFGLRTIGFMIDCIVIALVVGVIFTTSLYLTRWIIPTEGHSAISFIIAQLFGISFVVGYLIIPTYKYGGTIGQKLLGLRIVDRNGNIPHINASIVRFAYFCFSMLFIIPLVGYLVIPFRKSKQGFHDQLAGTYVVTEHPKKKALIAWVLLIALTSGILWKGYQIIPWLPFISGFKYQTEVFLEPIWEKNFKNTPTSYLKIENRFIYTTSTSISSVDMNSGSTIWAIDSLSRPMIQQFHSIPDPPLIVIEKPQPTGSSVLRIDSNTGTVLWKVHMDIEEPMLSSDGKIIYVYNYKRVVAYTVSGQFIWERKFQDNFITHMLVPNQDVLIERGNGIIRNFVCLSAQTGDVIWEMKNSSYTRGLTIGHGYQCMVSDKGKTALMFIPEKQIIWESSSIGYVMAHAGIPFEKEYPSKSIFYTDTGAVSGEDGGLLFSYPIGTRLVGVTDNYIVVLRNDDIENSSAMIMLDKFSGVEKNKIQIKRYAHLIFLHEDNTYIYLGGIPERKDQKRLESVLIYLDKQTFEVKDLICGKNLSVDGVVFLPDKRLFISSFHQIGLYAMTPKQQR